MKKVTVFVFLLFCLVVCGSLQAQVQPAPKGQDKFWKVPGYRHGPSFFPRNFLVETTPLKERKWDFKHYHTNTEMVWWYKKWQKKFPDLLDVYVAAKSFGGLDIYQLTLTNKKTGKATDKPAMFIDGNRHAGEVTAAESAFWMLHHMLTKYGKDDQITHMVDNFTFYFRPKNNPDGSMLYLETAQSLRSTIRPYDNDRDGLLDEDPAEDLDGDGFIRQMRIKVPKGEGRYIIDPCDPKGRLMKRAEPGQGDYNLMSEGIDNDKDGKINEDGIGGLDLHRNYPENWRPMAESTGRAFTQYGAGAYPLSEIETRSLVVFLLEHPHISIMNTMDTSVPMHLRPPSTSPGEERMFTEDLELYKYFDEKGKEITGYERSGDVYQDYGHGRPLFGHSPDFGYWYYGAIWYGDELWHGGKVGDYDGDGKTNDWDSLQFNKKELEKSRFKKWKKLRHPQYGKVEVGGWNPKFWRQNPPPELLEEWAEKEARFNLMLAANLPHVVIYEPNIYSKENEYLIEVKVENEGFLPTALRQAQLVKIVKPDTLTLEFPDGILPKRTGDRGTGRNRSTNRDRNRAEKAEAAEQTEQKEKSKVEILQPKDHRPTVTIDRLKGHETKTVIFKVRLNKIKGTKATVKYTSTRGGLVTRKIFIGQKNSDE